jgi:hypothetical protein
VSDLQNSPHDLVQEQIGNEHITVWILVQITVENSGRRVSDTRSCLPFAPNAAGDQASLEEGVSSSYLRA